MKYRLAKNEEVWAQGGFHLHWHEPRSTPMWYIRFLLLVGFYQLTGRARVRGCAFRHIMANVEHTHTGAGHVNTLGKWKPSHVVLRVQGDVEALELNLDGWTLYIAAIVKVTCGLSQLRCHLSIIWTWNA